jgi:hypothetical protein
MPASTRSGRPWTVHTTKRTAATSEPYRKKRQRLSFDDSAVRKPRQQTLTQIQFAPRTPSSQHYDKMEPIEIGAESKRTLPKMSKKHKQPRTSKGLKMQRSTLTQMDFLATNRHEYGGGDGEPEMTMVDATGDRNVEDGKENVDPNPPKLAARAKGMATATAGEAPNQPRKRKREASGVETFCGLGWHGRSPRPTNRGGVYGTVLADREPDQHAANAGDPSVTEKRQAITKVDGEQPEAEPCRRISSDEKETTHPGYTPLRASIPETPKRRRNVIPSSQSPESVSTSTRKRPLLLQGKLKDSPLKKRSTNTTPGESPISRKSRGSSAVKNGLRPKSKICVLRYGPGWIKKPDLPEADLNDVISRLCQAPNPPLQQHLAKDDITSYTGGIEMDMSALETPRDPEPEISKTNKIIYPGFVLSSRTDSEEEEIPEMSKGFRWVTSTPSISRSEESLPMLSNASKTAMAVNRTQSRETLHQLEPLLLDTEFQVHDFKSRGTEERLDPKQDIPTPRRTVADTATAGQRLYKKVTQTERGVSTIADSQDEDYDDEDISFGLPASLTNDNQLPSSSIRPLPNSRVATSGRKPPPTSDDAPSSADPSPAPPLSSYPPTTITRIPTKLSSSSSSPSSSPSLPRLAPPKTAPPPTTTQQSIHPASMTRLSQVSTQAGTQQSRLPTSSMPLPNTATTSSPSHGNGVEHVTIKDSSSVPTPLEAIPSQPQSPSPVGALGTLAAGPGNDIHIQDGYLDRDDDLDPKSSPPARESVQIEPTDRAEVVADSGFREHYSPGPPTADEQIEQIAQHYVERKSPTHAQTTPRPSRRRSQVVAALPQQQHPLPARLQLPDSMLESLPGPPGWVPPPHSPALSSIQWRGSRDLDPDWDWDDRMLSAGIFGLS